MPHDYRKYKPTRISAAAHKRLKEYCEKTGETQSSVVSRLVLNKLGDKDRTQNSRGL